MKRDESLFSTEVSFQSIDASACLVLKREFFNEIIRDS
jgi:hypothetical protein